MVWLMMRHGETDWNREGRIQGLRDIGLNETGREQIRRAGRDIKRQIGRPVSLIVTSPLKRAVESALIVSEIFGAPVLPFPPLKERSFGQLEGKTFLEIRQQYQIEDVEAIEDEAFGTEGMGRLRERVAQGLFHLSSAYSAQPLLIITHGSILKCIGEMCGLSLGILPNAAWVDIPTQPWQDGQASRKTAPCSYAG
ncbi:MAG: histidine phosphatase family protein [Brevibacillus sp.]|nr:histidine phosphatase family protein [Brevibacillus sp.]